MSEAKTKLGKAPCPVCGEPVHVRVNAAGTVSVACPECDFSGFAKKGTKGAQLLTGPFKAPPAPNPPADPPKVKAPPTPFNMDQLS